MFDLYALFLVTYVDSTWLGRFSSEKDRNSKHVADPEI